MRIKILRDLTYLNGGALETVLTKDSIVHVDAVHKDRYDVMAGGKIRYVSKKDAMWIDKPYEPKAYPFQIGNKVVKKSGNNFKGGARIATVKDIVPATAEGKFRVYTDGTIGFLYDTELELAKTGEEPKVQTGTIQTEKVSAARNGQVQVPHSLQHFASAGPYSIDGEKVPAALTELVEKAKGEWSVVDGVGPDAPIVYNEQGGGQSASPYRLDLVDPKALLDISKVLKEGADKYGENNWKKISINDHLNHLLVHVYAYLAGDKSDKHLAHAACRAIFALGVELEEK